MFDIALNQLYENSTYTEFLLEPLPISDKILNPLASVALHNGNKTYFIKEKCLNIEKTRLCNINNLIDATEDSCYSNLLKGLSGNCTFVKCLQPTEIRRITDNHIVTTNTQDIEVDSNCGLTKRNISGTYLIEFHNCSIFINGTRYNNVEAYKSEPTFVMPLDGLHINEKTLEVRNIDEIHVRNMHYIETLTKEHNIRTYTSLSMSTICILLSIVTGLFWIPRRRKQISLHIGTSKESKPLGSLETRSISVNRDDSSSKGGVVKNEPSWTTTNRFIGASLLSSSPSTTTTTTTTTPMTTTKTQQSA
ncbi:uncharacterized protein LOC135708498 [Ochlerotatus camptorhynchus]|uniref:uncharacterized protein LOC135708498 n=1 Tax=Ochlerotatus camptorhynchus TaxID=644619 RepID=UPI0031D718F6